MFADASRICNAISSKISPRYSSSLSVGNGFANDNDVAPASDKSRGSSPAPPPFVVVVVASSGTSLDVDDLSCGPHGSDDDSSVAVVAAKRSSSPFPPRSSLSVVVVAVARTSRRLASLVFSFPPAGPWASSPTPLLRRRAWKAPPWRSSWSSSTLTRPSSARTVSSLVPQVLRSSSCARSSPRTTRAPIFDRRSGFKPPGLT
mmetsp:Transcript_5323/g.17474  ORF Transcript_5323/g.17474 Transcript_5323/m.17474 type:complete len:203 (-) Transcript_5323:313-921(-)